MYDYIHNVCYWIGSKRYHNLKMIINNIKDLHLNNVLILFNVMYDNNNFDKTDFENLKLERTNTLDIDILYNFNSGGTVKSLYYTYQYIKKNNISCNLVATYEDDYSFKDINTFKRASELLKDGYIFVGSSWYNEKTEYSDEYVLNNDTCFHSFANVDFEKNAKGRGKRLQNFHISKGGNSDYFTKELYIWTEDPYITTYDNLNKIYEKMGVFTLAPDNELYEKNQHGISYGEIGFCVRLSLNGFKFIGLLHDTYFKYLDTTYY